MRPYRVQLPGAHVSILASLDLIQVLQLGLILGRQGMHVPRMLHDLIHCNALLHIGLKDTIQQAAALARQLQVQCRLMQFGFVG